MNRSSCGIRASHGPMGVAVGVGDGVTVGEAVAVAVGSGVLVGCWATAVSPSTDGGGKVGVSTGKPVGTSVGKGGGNTAVSNPQPANKNVPKQSSKNLFIAPDCTKSGSNRKLTENGFPV
ncbi:MAG: hypothetical protein H6655_22395 [Ardenticatenaceae bacterium]|nr:hypothetical protein [Ardenticatenaceae bacterium]